MSERKFSEIKVGVFVFLAAFIVLATLFWAKGFIVSKDQIDLKAYFKNVNGLNVGDPVTVNGVRKGKVQKFDLEGDSVSVELTLEKTVKIKKDYKIEIAMLELMAGKQVLITPGVSNDEIDYNRPLIGETGSDITVMMKNLNDVTLDVKGLMKKFDKTVEDLDITINNINDVVGDKDMHNNLKSTLSNLNIASKHLNSLLAENRVTFKDITGKVGNTIDNVNGILDESGPQVKGTFKDIQSLTTRIDTLITGINTIVSDIQMQKGSVGKFMYDDKFYENLNKSLLEIENLSKKIRKDGIKINLF
ncbi:MAG: MlaD family protein [Ignavibacteria bacterium]|jgi:phospholipid/cholesterol/gamma-HCH transport system substrate-binding protein